MPKRAMTEAAKAAKAQAIMDCTAKLFLAADYEAVKMSHVAREMHLSNGILFVYFPTKQTLFFSLLMRAYHARVDALQQRLLAKPALDFAQLSALILDDLNAQLDSILYVRLEAIRAAILEKNIQPGLVLSMKTKLYKRMISLAQKASIPGVISAQDILKLFHVQTAMIAGFYIASDLPPSLRAQFLENDLEAFVHDTKQDTLSAMRLYLQAYQATR